MKLINSVPLQKVKSCDFHSIEHLFVFPFFFIDLLSFGGRDRLMPLKGADILKCFFVNYYDIIVTKIESMILLWLK